MIQDTRIHFTYCNAIVDQKILQHEVLHRIQIAPTQITNLLELQQLIPLEKISLSSNLEEISQSLIKGSIYIQLEPDFNEGLLVVYMDGICNPQHVNTVRQRLLELNFDVIFDSSILDQVLADNANSPFPLFMSSERVDRTEFNLLNGQVALLSNGSPYVISGPTTVFDFFISPEDYYSPWVLGSFFRCIRYFGVAFSILASPVYVAVLTFHYSVIPQSLLTPNIESRANVPFAPIFEVLLLELTVELLREAGARLPTKVRQTLGIVGGIVLGEAAVQAGLTSNILIIIVSLSALSSFATPIFKMSNTIRFLRFPLMCLAAAWGGLGVIMGLVILLGHLLRLKSLGTPYIVPMFPFRFREFNSSIDR